MNKELNHIVLCTLEDSQLMTSYKLIQVNARELSSYLKANLKLKDINPDDYNADDFDKVDESLFNGYDLRKAFEGYEGEKLVAVTQFFNYLLRLNKKENGK